MAAGNQPDQAALAQAFATIASAFTVQGNQSGPVSQSTSSPVTVAVNSPHGNTLSDANGLGSSGSG